MWFRFLYVTKITFYAAMVKFYVVNVGFFSGGGGNILSGFMWPR